MKKAISLGMLMLVAVAAFLTQPSFADLMTPGPEPIRFTIVVYHDGELTEFCWTEGENLTDTMKTLVLGADLINISMNDQSWCAVRTMYTMYGVNGEYAYGSNNQIHLSPNQALTTVIAVDATGSFLTLLAALLIASGVGTPVAVMLYLGVFFYDVFAASYTVIYGADKNCDGSFDMSFDYTPICNGQLYITLTTPKRGWIVSFAGAYPYDAFNAGYSAYLAGISGSCGCHTL